MRVAACERSEESLGRRWPEVAEDGSCASLRSRTRRRHKMLSRRTASYPRTQRIGAWLKLRVSVWGDSSCSTDPGHESDP